jgi:hypothetical protein
MYMLWNCCRGFRKLSFQYYGSLHRCNTGQLRVTEIRPSTEKDRLLSEARKLKMNYEVFMLQGRYEDANESIEKALRISESVLAADDPFIGRSFVRSWKLL